MNPNQSLIPRGEWRIQDAAVDPIFEHGMNQVEVKLLCRLDDAGLKPDKVALRILNDTFVVAARFRNGRAITLTFDVKHIPGILKEEDYGLIADGIIEHYRASILPKPEKYATARRDGYDVPLIGIPPEAGPSKGDFREDPNPQKPC